MNYTRNVRAIVLGVRVLETVEGRKPFTDKIDKAIFKQLQFSRC